MTDINDILSRCKLQSLKADDAKKGDLWIFTLDNPTQTEYKTFKETLLALRKDDWPGILIWRDSPGDVTTMRREEAIALRDTLNVLINENVQRL